MPKKEKEISIKDVYEAIGSLRTEITDNFVSKAEFLPVKLITYGMVGIILTAVLTAVIGQVIVKAAF